MSERKNLSSIVPDQDERIGARATGGASARQPKSRPAPAKSNHQPEKHSGGGIWKVLVVVLFLAALAGGWYGWQQHQQVASLQSSFDELTARLASTDDSLSKSGDALLLKIKEQNQTLEKHWSEIRKLWGVSNDRNKKKIEKNQKDIAVHSNRLAKIDKATAGLDKAVKQSDLNTKQIASINGTLLSSNVDMETLQQQLQQAVQQFNSMESSFKTWQQQVNGRLNQTDEAIDSIDAYRRQINQELLQLRQGSGG
ncbi:hypothetical protein KFE80_05845 [bacterium SCSIO 12696]|nr:hypothetical protein KFE80_05845 [bacterium SCSIO 12696]